MSYVRRSGAVLTNVAYNCFIHVIQSVSNTNQMIDAIWCEYHALLTHIVPNNQVNHCYMVINATVMGVTDEYVNVIIKSNNTPTRVLRSAYNTNIMIYDTKYYRNLLNNCVASVARALGLPNASYITTSMPLNNGI